MDNNEHIPIYFKISKEIIDLIRNKKLRPGDKIPSENEIIKKYNVSNTTARKVLLEIEKGGWVVKIKGKGTYVKDISVNRSATKVLSFTKNMRQKGFTPSTQVLDIKILNKAYTKTISGRNYTLKSPICKITRLRLAEGIPIMLENRYISMELCPDLEKQDLTGSLYEFYDKKYALNISKIDQMLSAIILDKKQLAAFNLTESITGLFVEGATFCGREILLELEESVYKGDKYKFSVLATP